MGFPCRLVFQTLLFYVFKHSEFAAFIASILTAFGALFAPSAALAQTGASDFYCPEGSLYSSANRLCMTTLAALGPFPPLMSATCKSYRGDIPDCDRPTWDLYFAGVFRGTAECPAGSSRDASLSVCSSEEYAYGPFSKSLVEKCKQLGWGYTCETMRWSKSMVLGATPPPPAPPPTLPVPPQGNPGIVTPPAAQKKDNARLFEYYSVRSNYNSVYRDVLNWYGTTENACVAFLSSALRAIRISVPRSVDQEGLNISLVTGPFRDYLRDNLGWTRMSSANDVLPGDVVFTLDDRQWPGHPAHVYMFHSWTNRDAGSGLVIDNQGFIHERNIFGYSSGNFTPFQYAYRSPN